MYSLLYNKNLSITDKVKVVRYAWKNPCDDWPNKEQEVLNWLTTMVLNRKRISAEDCLSVWRCLCDVLSTTRCQQQISGTQQLILKPAFYQALLNEVSRLTASTKHCNVIISCCYKLLTSPIFGHVWGLRLDNLLQLLNQSIRLCSEQMDGQLSNHLLQLLSDASRIYAAGCKKSGNPQQIIQQICQKLFLPVAKFRYVSKRFRGELKELINQTVHDLEATLLTALYPSDLSGSYELYLKLKTSEDKTESIPPKHIAVLFTQIASCVQTTETRQAVLDILPLLYEGFIQQYVNTNSTMCFQYCQYLLELLHVLPSKPSVVTETSWQLKTEEQLKTIQQLLHIMIKKDVYNMTADHIAGDKQLSWFRSFSKWLNAVEVNERTSVWFSIQRQLLELNYAIIEPNLKMFFTVTWLQIGELAEAKDSQAELLCDLVNMYTHLRQLPKLFTRLLEILRQTDLKEKVYFPEQLDVCLLQNFLKQPLTVILSIWQSLIENIISHHLVDGSSREALGFVCQILSTLLSSIRVVDQGITHQVQTEIQDLMRQTGQKVLYPLVKKIFRDLLGDQTPLVLELVHSWGQLQLLMVKYMLYGADWDTGTLHYYLEKKQWQKLGRLQNVKNCTKSRLFWIKLQHQDLRCKLCTEQPDTVAPSVVQMVDETLQHLNHITASDVVWNQQCLSITADNIHVAIWSTLCDLLPVVSHLLSGHQMKKLARHIVTSLSERKKHIEVPGTISMASITKSLISNGCMWEIPQLTTAIIQCLWLKLSSQINEISSPRPLKRRKLSSEISVPELLQEIAQSDMNDSGEVVSFCKRVHPVLTFSPSLCDMDVNVADRCTHLLQVMDQQPLLFLSPSNQLKHVLCLLTLLCSLKPTKVNHPVLEIGLKQLLISYSSPQSRHLSQHISPVFVLKWLVSDVHKQLPRALHRAMLELYKVLYRQTCCSVDNQHSVYVLTQEFLTHWNEDNVDEWLFPFLIIMLESTVRLLKKTYVAKDLLDGVHSIQLMLSKWLEATLSRWWSSCDPELNAMMTQTPVFKAQVLRGYSAILKANRKTDVSDTVAKNMCNICINLLQSSTKDSDVLEDCLIFVRAICHTENGRDGTFVGNNDTMVTGDDDTDIDKSDNGETENKQLDDVKSIGIEPSGRNEPSEHVVMFVTECWECLLKLLHNFYSQTQDMSTKCCDFLPAEIKIQQTVGYLIHAASTKQFLGWLNLLLNNICLDISSRSPQDTILSLRIWTMLLETVSCSSHQKRLLTASQHLVFSIHHLVIELDVNTIEYCPLIMAALTAEATLLATQQVSLHFVSLVIQTCCCIPLNDISTSQFILIFTAVQKVITTILSHYQECVVTRIPILCLATRHLLKALVWHGRQQTETVDELDVTRLAKCAQLMESLLNQLCMYKTECTKVAAYIVADYTASLHKVTLLPQVKANLLPGIYHCLRVCDEHAIALLHATLSHGLVEIFKSIYTDYTKYYKYTGKV